VDRIRQSSCRSEVVFRWTLTLNGPSVVLGRPALGAILLLAGFFRAWMPIHGLCPMAFRSVDTYSIRLVAPPVSDRSALDRTSDWAPEECAARMQTVLVTLILCNMGALFYLRRGRGNRDMDGST